MLACIVGLILVYHYYHASSSRSPPPPRPTTTTTSLDHPNFDFDHATDPAAAAAFPLHEDAELDHGRTLDQLDIDRDEEEEEEESEEEGVKEWKPVIVGGGTRLDDDDEVEPFLPLTCDAATMTTSASVKYLAKSSSLETDVVDRATLFKGTGKSVRRVLTRAIKSSLYRSKRLDRDDDDAGAKFRDEEPFRTLVLGGSGEQKIKNDFFERRLPLTLFEVSNCRGVDPKSTCWHSRVFNWFQTTLPLEGDDPTSNAPPAESFLVDRVVSPLQRGPTRLDTRDKVKRQLDAKPDTAKTKNDKNKGNNKKKKKKKTSSSSSRRAKPVHRLINGSKSATGSSFFAYCYDDEMALRGKLAELGPRGPDLVVLEYGVNDVYPLDDSATSDFERLVRHLVSLESRPAVVILESASLLLASSSPREQARPAEYLHLPVAQFYDVPILSVRQSLFGGRSPLARGGKLSIKDLFLADQHHPNERGHELMADVLIDYLERELCRAEADVVARVNSQRRQQRRGGRHGHGGTIIDPESEVVRRDDEQVDPVPTRSLFDPFSLSSSSQEETSSFRSRPTCVQVGNSKTTIEPVENIGWRKFGWARDKQYLVADRPSSRVTFEVDVPENGEGDILVDWLRSRFYDLGNVAVTLDGDDTTRVVLAGYWGLGWSIGVPTRVFRRVKTGKHRVTFELLGPDESSHPHQKTHFRLIALIST